MKKQRTKWHDLASLVALASCGLGVFVGAEPDKKDSPKPLPPEIVKAWRDAGADVGWMKALPPKPSRAYKFWEPFRENGETGAVPAFRYHPNKEGVPTKLPDPGIPFGLDAHCSAMRDAELKELGGLNSLQTLNLGACQLLSDTGLKELAQLKNLQALYLFFAHVTDAGLKELAGLKNLQVLDLSNTQVTDAGLKELAGLKSLQWLNLYRTKVTSTGIAALQKELPKCKIITGDE